jgi:hypothetical protein
MFRNSNGGGGGCELLERMKKLINLGFLIFCKIILIGKYFKMTKNYLNRKIIAVQWFNLTYTPKPYTRSLDFIETLQLVLMHCSWAPNPNCGERMRIIFFIAYLILSQARNQCGSEGACDHSEMK